MVQSKPWAFETPTQTPAVTTFDVVLTTHKGDVVLVEGADTYIEALGFVVEYSRREMSQRRHPKYRATRLVESTNGWYVHYCNRIDTIQIVEMVSHDN